MDERLDPMHFAGEHRAWTSVRKPTRSCKLRPSRSTDHAAIRSNWRRLASLHSASNAGRFSLDFAPLIP